MSVKTVLSNELTLAAKHGNLNEVISLIAKGANVRSQDDRAFRTAAENGHLEVVKYLHRKGANIRAGDGSAIRWAAFYGYPDVVEYLYEHGLRMQDYCAMTDTVRERLTMLQARDSLIGRVRNTCNRSSQQSGPEI